MDGLIVARGLCKSFFVGRGSSRQEIPVLNDVNIEIGAGEVVSIVGPSGSGKTTLLYCLAGLESPTAGTVSYSWLSRERNGKRAGGGGILSEIGFVFQSYNLIPYLNVIDNIVLPLRLSGQRVSGENVEGILLDIGLSEKKLCYPEDLSSGEQQRVAVARSLLARRTLLLADEPTGALDSLNSSKVIGMLRKVALDGSRSVVMVTHDLDMACCSDRVLVLRDGEVIDEFTDPSPVQLLKAMEAL